MVVFGFATWGAYLCGVSDVKEEIIQTAVEEYMKSGVYKRKQIMLTAGEADALIVDAAPGAIAPVVNVAAAVV